MFWISINRLWTDHIKEMEGNGLITFSDRQIRVPKLARPVYMISGGMSQFARAFPRKKTEELVIEAFLMMGCGAWDRYRL